jgi:surface antigen
MNRSAGWASEAARPESRRKTDLTTPRSQIKPNERKGNEMKNRRSNFVPAPDREGRLATKFRRHVGSGIKMALGALLAVGMLVTMVAPAGASTAYGPYLTLASPTLNERSAPSTSGTVVATLAYHSTISITCQILGSPVNGSSIWDRLANGAYVSDYWVNTPNFATWSPPIPRCGTTPPPAGLGTWGQTLSYNPGGTGQCTWGAEYEFHAHTGTYINTLGVPGTTGDAKYWSTNAKARGWTVTTTPMVNSLVVFQPGADLADPTYGHVAWVTAVNVGGNPSKFTVHEMHFTNGLGNWDYRTTYVVTGVSFIQVPPLS